MKAKKSKGAARAKASAVPARRLFLTDTTRLAVCQAREVYKLATWDEAAGVLLSRAICAGTLTPHYPPEFAPSITASRGSSAHEGQWPRSCGLIRLKRRVDENMQALAAELGLPVGAAIALALDWIAPRDIALTLAARESDPSGAWPDDDDNAGEEWKKGGVA